MKTKHVKVVSKKLGREKADGQAFQSKNLIEIDPRLKSKEYFATLLHELLHLAYPNLSEDEVLIGEKMMIDCLWEQNFRQVDQ